MDVDEALRWAGRVSCGCNEQEYRWIWETIVSAPGHVDGRVIEIGSWRGAGTLVMAAACEERGFKLLSIDTWHLGVLERQHLTASETKLQEGPVTFDLFMDCTRLLVEAGLRRHVIQIVGDSLEVAERVLWPHNHDVVFLWIDGWHEHPQAYLEWRAYHNLVRQGGVVGFHDAQEVDGAKRSLRVIEEEGGFEGWVEVDVPQLGAPARPSPGSTIDNQGPWRTRAWRRTI